MLEIITFVLGPVQTNTYLLADPETGEAAVIDPAWEGQVILAEVQRRNWQVGQIWLTHAHFDHFGGVAALAQGSNPIPSVALHAEDLPLWGMQGGASLFGFRIDPGPEPKMELHHGQVLTLGRNQLEVRHCPGHTLGHVIFYCADHKVAFVGDVIFQGGIGRTDLPGGNYSTLLQSIQAQILSLPEDTRLLSGHGPSTTVALEKVYNPFL